jgi:hypothetical protein
MDVKLLSAFRSLPLLRDTDELEVALSKLLTSASEPLTIKGVRDKFSMVNRQAKSGQIQVVRGAPGEETVIVSMKALAEMMRAVATNLSFADALDAVGFVPAGGRLVQREGFQPDTGLALKVNRKHEAESAAIAAEAS